MHHLTPTVWAVSGPFSATIKGITGQCGGKRTSMAQNPQGSLESQCPVFDKGIHGNNNISENYPSN